MSQGLATALWMCQGEPGEDWFHLGDGTNLAVYTIFTPSLYLLDTIFTAVPLCYLHVGQFYSLPDKITLMVIVPPAP